MRDYAEAKQVDRDVVLFGARCFNLAQTLDCGQAFRWREVGADCFAGVAHGRLLEIYAEDDRIIFKDMRLNEFESLWKNYFDLDRDYDELRKIFSVDRHLEKAIAFSSGLRLLRQDVWEVLISFILSQNANIPRIKKMVETLCECFGEKLPRGGHAFPNAKTLASLDVADLAPVKCGYRADYVLDAARRVAGGEFDIATLEGKDSDEVYRALLNIHGVGPKVADCVLLYGFGRVERYPVDVWIKRAMTRFFPNGFPYEIQKFSGIAQQFLFHYIRNIML